ncbi:DHA2 family efflux MFS transporter permease subunit [Kutzneria sp. NPDC052558]|uniref:DHA2 family efflux MFS transporter permease subunit n=1 Tax=Kutzneria sp. NPDC052558 TaxID=3364121 RepID=UPI0037CAF9BC
MSVGLDRPRLRPTVVMSVVFVASMFISILDTTIVNVALPKISVDLGVAPVDTRAIAVGYLVSTAMVIPASGWFGDRFGRKRVLLWALAAFTVASALCGLADSLVELTVFRVLQGLGGGMLGPVAMAMMFHVFPPDQRMRVSQIMIAPTAVAPALGPVLGGLLVDKLSWQFVFYVNIPIGIAVLLFGLFFLTEQRQSSAGRFDLAGFLLSCAGSGLLMFALTEGATLGWTSPLIVVTGLAGIALLVLLVVVELRTPQPMLDLKLFADRMFRSINIVTAFSTATFLGALFVFPLLYQDALGASALETGLIGFPEAIGVMVGTQLATRVHRALGSRRQLALALVNVAVGLALLGLVGRATDPWLTRLIMFYLGLGMGNVMSVTRAAAFATLPPPRMGSASALFSTSGQVGAAIGVAVLGTVLATAGASGQADLSAYHLAFFVAAALTLVGAACALAIPAESRAQ